ncbi:MAG TPA: c-type cytochrome [Ferruginibacter sp.]|nr:c-type cytochrome [Ferruginibacter sp.]
MRSFKKLKVIGALTLIVFVGIAAVKQPKTDRFRNLQVLPKNITEDSLGKLMDLYSASLKVNCDYCHVHDKKADTMIWHKDDKPEKEITRNMMRMTADINEKYFHFNEDIKAGEVQAVTCYTCHKGSPMPEKEKKK